MFPIPFIDQFLFAGLPYLALLALVAGCAWRWKSNRFSYTSLSSQFLESQQLYWGSGAWHAGLMGVLAGHLLALALPGFWASLMSVRPILLAVETAGVALAVIGLAGLLVLLVRRVTSARLQNATTPVDLLVLILLLAQMVLGLATGLQHPWGAFWAPQVLGPYLWGLATFQPDAAAVAFFPTVVKLHLVGAWLILLLFPFSRLVHALLFPFRYWLRPPQRVVWNTLEHDARARCLEAQADARRDFLKGAAGVIVATGLLSAGILEKLVRYFRGPREGSAEALELLEKKMRRLQQAAEERALELERQSNEFIFVARYAELQPAKGKYLIDYAMAPALAFKGADGLPLLISAKCTHLGCTVASEMNSQGKILCPCHISYFDVQTGRPDSGAPAKTPLRHLEWVMRDQQGRIVARRDHLGKVQAPADPAALGQCGIYIVKPKEDRQA